MSEEHWEPDLKIDKLKTQVSRLEAERDALKARVERMEKALKEISIGAGRYSMDPFEHCRNTVEDMKELAKSALSEGGGAE